MIDRRDPMLPFASAVLAARMLASERGGVATFGRVQVEPNGTNAVPSKVTAWLDARGPDQEIVDEILAGVTETATMRARDEHMTVAVTAESVSVAVLFSTEVTTRLHRVLDQVAGLAGYPTSVRVPATMRGCFPPWSRPRCCSYATRPASRTRRQSSLIAPTALPASRRSLL